MTTKDEALRVAREALEPFAKFGTPEVWALTMLADKGADAQVIYSHATGDAIKLGDFFRAVSALRTIALAVEAPSEPDLTDEERAALASGGNVFSDCYAVQSVGLGEPKDDAAWDASQIKPPGWDHVFAAFVEGAREARSNPDATEDDFRRAADGHTKRVFEEVDPVSEAALRTESWRVAAASASGAVGETAGKARGGIYVECRECADCGHVGVNDAHPTNARCGECGWSGPEPKEDRCPGCGAENVMGAACPKCSGRYTIVAEADIQILRAAAALAGDGSGQDQVSSMDADRGGERG